MKRIKKKIASNTKSSGLYTVIKFIEKSGDKLFDCMPDVWFTDKSKNSCFWPPPKGKKVAIRAIKQEMPDESWEMYHCEVVKEGFATYSCGRALVRAKCLQTYNTSSAEEHLETAKFRRQHPGLSALNLESFEDVFATKKSVNSVDNHQTKESTSSADKSSKDGNRSGQISTFNDNQLSQNTTPNVSQQDEAEVHDANLVSQKNTEGRSPRHSSPTSIISYETICRIGSKGASVSSSVSKRRRSRSNESSNRSLSSDSHSSSNSGSRNSYSSQQSSSKSSQTRNGSRSRSIHLPLIDPRRQSSSTGRSNENNNSGRVNRRTHSRASKISSVGSSTSSKHRRSRSKESSTRSISSRSYSSSNTKSRRKHESSSGKYQRSGSIHLPSIASRGQGSSIGRRQHSPSKRTFDKNLPSSCSSSCQSQILVKNLMKEVRDLTKTVCKYNQENDRRMSRMEVTNNKILVRLGDITRSNTTHSIDDSRDVSRGYSGEDSRREGRNDKQVYYCEEPEDARANSHGPRRFLNPRDQRCPELPILSLNELSDVNQQFKNKDFFTFLVNREKEFCMPSKNVTDNVVMTTYLKRFISLRVRSLLTLKELKDGQGLTLFTDFYNVYTFLIEVMQEAYKSCKKSLAQKEAHETLRIVWGRSKQLLNDQQKKRK